MSSRATSATGRHRGGDHVRTVRDFGDNLDVRLEIEQQARARCASCPGPRRAVPGSRTASADRGNGSGRRAGSRVRRTRSRPAVGGGDALAQPEQAGARCAMSARAPVAVVGRPSRARPDRRRSRTTIEQPYARGCAGSRSSPPPVPPSRTAASTPRGRRAPTCRSCTSMPASAAPPGRRRSRVVEVAARGTR